MMDWGMFRLSEKLSSTGKGIIEEGAGVKSQFATSYDWQRNRLVVDVKVWRADDIEAKAKADMVTAVYWVRAFLGRGGFDFLRIVLSQWLQEHLKAK